MGLADVHAHLTHPRLIARVSEILERARAAGVTTVISNGLNPRDNLEVKALSAGFPAVKPAFGFYPVEAAAVDLPALDDQYSHGRGEGTAEDGIAWLREHLDQAFAIGEIGLDGHWVPEPAWPRQEEVFSRLVRLALDGGKPIIVHSRKRENRTFEILRELGAARVIWHCFGGKLSLARSIAEQGHYLSIPANAARADNFRRMLKELPRAAILLETDSPYLGPVRDQDNEPSNVAGTAALTAELWNVSIADVVQRLTENFVNLFGVEP